MVPADVKVAEPLSPFRSEPVSNEPSSAVAVWTVGPSFVQVIVSPSLTVTDAGRELEVPDRYRRGCRGLGDGLLLLRGRRLLLLALRGRGLLRLSLRLRLGARAPRPTPGLGLVVKGSASTVSFTVSAVSSTAGTETVGGTSSAASQAGAIRRTSRA